MIKILVEEQYFTDIANAIRNKVHSASSYYLSEMPTEIVNITTMSQEASEPFQIMHSILNKTIRFINDENGYIGKIRNYAFHNCTALQTVFFPRCTSIGADAFYNCSSLQTVSFPSCTTIGPNAFQNCITLQSVSFPKCVSIESFVFYGCSRLTSLYLLGNSLVSLTNYNTFSQTPIGGYSDITGEYGSIYVPASLYQSYISYGLWSWFSERFISVE